MIYKGIGLYLLKNYLSSRSSIGRAELWRCLGYKFESYLGRLLISNYICNDYVLYMTYLYSLYTKLKVWNLFSFFFFWFFWFWKNNNNFNGYAGIGRQVSLRTGWQCSYKFKSCYPYIIYLRLCIILFIFFYIGGCSSKGRTAVCGTVSSLFKSGYPPLYSYIYIYMTKTLIISQDSSIG